MLTTLRQTFDRPVGLSDHHAGDEMLYAAVALGAHALEKGIIPDGMQRDQDVHHALPIALFEEVWVKCRRIHAALGSNMRYARRDREKYISRMGLAAAQDLSPGDVVTLENVRFAFPAKGIPVEHWEIVAGWKLRKPVSRGAVIRWQDVEPSAA
jgi:sialic acid synthase SpsE